MSMAKLRAHNLAVSLDGYLAGPGQSVENPLGVGGEGLHEWVFAEDRGPVDSDFVARGTDGIGATVMGRNMFGPVRGDWESWSGEWRGWWGDDPPFHHPVFVVTHHARPPIEMDGGTVFHFVTDGVEAAVEAALEAAGGLDVRVGGGASVVQQCLRAGLLDEVHVAVVPILLGGGERLFDNVDGVVGYSCEELVASPTVAHVRLVKNKEG